MLRRGAGKEEKEGQKRKSVCHSSQIRADRGGMGVSFVSVFRRGGELTSASSSTSVASTSPEIFENKVINHRFSVGRRVCGARVTSFWGVLGVSLHVTTSVVVRVRLLLFFFFFAHVDATVTLLPQ